MWPLVILKVMIVSHKSHHPDGLFLTQVTTPFFLVSSMFSKSRWVKRKLSFKELLAVMDLPVSVISQLSSGEQRIIVHKSIFTPMKCMSAFTSTIFIKGIV